MQTWSGTHWEPCKQEVEHSVYHANRKWNTVNKMGCIQPGEHSPGGVQCRINHEENEAVEGVAYNRTPEKFPNELNPENLMRGFSKKKKNVRKTKYDQNILTPSQLDLDNLSLASINSNIDIAAITETDKHWYFPAKWGVSKKCTFCGDTCHTGIQKKENNTSGTLRKQNNQRMPGVPGSKGVCAMAFANLLAMVSIYKEG